MTEHTMPMLTDEQREDAIRAFTVRACNTDCDVSALAYQIALAALTAERSTLGEIESGIRALKMTLTKCNRMNYCRGVLMNLDDVVAKAKERTYTAPPVPALKQIELPDLRQMVSGERYVWGDGVFNYKQDVINAIRAAGYEVAE